MIFPASSVIRMIQKTFGQEVFKNAISTYLRQHKYSTATPKDLWKHFANAVNKTSGLGEWNITFESLMDGWTNKPGYPIVYAEYNFPTLKLTQVITRGLVGLFLDSSLAIHYTND